MNTLMKKRILFLSLMTIALATACKKDKSTPATSPDASRLKGDWDLEMRIEADYRNDTLQYQDTSTYQPDEIVYSFSSDSLTLYENGVPDEEKYGYTVIGNDLVLRSGSQGYFLQLKWYGNNRMSYIIDDTYVSSSGVRRRSVEEMIFNRK